MVLHCNLFNRSNRHYGHDSQFLIYASKNHQILCFLREHITTVFCRCCIVDSINIQRHRWHNRDCRFLCWVLHKRRNDHCAKRLLEISGIYSIQEEIGLCKYNCYSGIFACNIYCSWSLWNYP